METLKFLTNDIIEKSTIKLILNGLFIRILYLLCDEVYKY